MNNITEITVESKECTIFFNCKKTITIRELKQLISDKLDTKYSSPIFWNLYLNTFQLDKCEEVNLLHYNLGTRLYLTIREKENKEKEILLKLAENCNEKNWRSGSYGWEAHTDILRWMDVHLNRENKVHILDLYYKNMKGIIPEEFGLLEDLSRLDISNTSIFKFPRSFGNLKKLTKLKYEKASLVKIPDEIFFIPNLEHISLAENNLTTLPISVSFWKKLHTLNVSNNNLTELPEEIGEIEYLSKLYLSSSQNSSRNRNKLTKLPESIGNLVNLTQLHLTNNFICELPASIGNLKKLNILSLGNNKIKCLPKSFTQLTSLSILNIDNNELKELPEDIDSLINLSNFNISKNQIESLPSRFSKLDKLIILYADKNKISSLDNINFTEMSSLTHAYFSQNKLNSKIEANQQPPRAQIFELGIEDDWEYW